MPTPPRGRALRPVVAANVIVLIGGLIGISTIGPATHVEAAGRPGLDRSADNTASQSSADDSGTNASGVAGASGAGDTASPNPSANAARPGAPASSAKAPAAVASNGPGGSQSQAQPVKAPADGVYESRIVIDVNSSQGKRRRTGTDDTQITTNSRTGSEVRQTRESKRTFEDETADSEKAPTMKTNVRWAVDGLYTTPTLPDGATCSPPEELSIKTPLAKDSTWKSTTECTFHGPNGATSTSRSESTSTVVGSRQVDAVGRSLLVWEIRRTGKTTSHTKQGDFTFTFTGTELFSPELGFDVHVESRAVSAAPFNSDSTTTSDLVTITPA
ncbi:MAG: hypothetical protein QOK43_2759 [Acidimicrobiaceae bacterium]|nr:hypothetical protein [Acidimicrobiaceae bacterium]